MPLIEVFLLCIAVNCFIFHYFYLSLKRTHFYITIVTIAFPNNIVMPQQFTMQPTIFILDGNI